MVDFVNYIFESGISLALFTLLYFLFLQRETFFRTNRLFLLFALTFSALLPFVHLRVWEGQPVLLDEITVTPYRNLLETVSVYGTEVSTSIVREISASTYIIGIYLIGVCLFALRLLWRLAQISWLIHKNEVIREGGMKLVLLDREVTPFSFLSYVFAGKNLKTQDGWDKMLIHEFEHVKQGHSFDILVLEVLTVFQWFNPFFWLMKRLLRENHEYLADRAVLAHFSNPGYYKKLLLQQFVGPQINLANNFNYSLIKKRIQMMSQIKSSKLAHAKLFGGLVLACCLLVIFAVECKQEDKEQITESKVEKIIFLRGNARAAINIDSDSNGVFDNPLEFFKNSPDYEVVSFENGELVVRKTNTETEIEASTVSSEKSAKSEQVDKTIDGKPIFFIVDEMPEFPGGESALRAAIANEVKYPTQALEKGIQGKVYVSFVVDRTGKVRNAKIARGVETSLDTEALRVVSSLPEWTPGKQRGEAVAVNYTVPISFVLQ
ncbi:M56 family metallopeptidase [Mangrovibacterium diazotrophicum]|uniref:Outer membrane transport energization protein TonB n=1 Tax=Mangrovibacterium diazotrophicum TaxID=1261403 RepID=A0A419VZ81_9BACT|nr:M56 family metallopeptidase [Mangrovibacterium diazotrophicum]RKD88526.1 outer membrane transport energization protein TonB [Mangrovibacterium diazotrophicum]